MKNKYKPYVPLLLFVGLLILSYIVLKPLFTAIFLGGLLAYITFPLYRKFTTKVKSKSLSAFLVCILVLLLLLIPGIFMTKELVQESYTIFILAKQKLSTGLFEGCQNSFCEGIHSFVEKPEIEFQIQEGVKSVTSWLIDKGSNFLLSIPRVSLTLFVIFFTMFYFIRDGKIFLVHMQKILGLDKNRYNSLVKRTREITNGVVFGYILIAFSQGFVGGLGFYFFGITSPIFWGVMMGLLALIPFLGTGIIWFPAALVLILDGAFRGDSTILWRGIGLGLYSLILVSSLDNVIRPKMVSDKAKVHPAVILLGILGGVLTFGAIGVVAGPLILSLVIVFVDLYITDTQEKKTTD
jgi:predicted PurR-regulated permease PerM